jgi:hypothetical protein
MSCAALTASSNGSFRARIKKSIYIGGHSTKVIMMKKKKKKKSMDSRTLIVVAAM